MGNSFGLTEAEYLLMRYFWSKNDEIPFSEILVYCNENLKLNWAKTTLHTYLSRMIEKGLLTSSRNGYKRTYRAALDEAALAHRYSTDFMSKAFDSSLKNMLMALTYQTKLSSDEVEELKQILDACAEKQEE